MCSSPQLIAACHVLRRLPVPRHPPYALIFLTYSGHLPIVNFGKSLFSGFSVEIVYSLYRCSQLSFSISSFCDPTYQPIIRKIRLLRKEVIQPHLPIRLPCYDFTPVIGFALDSLLSRPASGTPNFHGVTGGVYKTRERIHRGILIRDY